MGRGACPVPLAFLSLRPKRELLSFKVYSMYNIKRKALEHFSLQPYRQGGSRQSCLFVLRTSLLLPTARGGFLVL